MLFRQNYLSGLLLLLFLSGCSAVSNLGPLPDGLEAEVVAKVEPGLTLAWNPVVDQVAMGSAGLRLLDLATRDESLLSPQNPLAVTWDGHSNRILAGFKDEENSLLRGYHPQGEQAFELKVPGQIAWIGQAPDGRISFVTIVVEVYKFGGNYKQILYTWDEAEAPAPSILVDVTLKPRTIKVLGAEIYRTAHITMAPLHDEILYTRIHDPPMFDPLLKLVLKNIATGREKVLGDLEFATAGGLFLADAEQVLYGDGFMQTRLVAPYTKTDLNLWPLPGRGLAVSAGGAYLFLDGQLLAAGEKIADFPAASRAWFSPRGKQMLLATAGRLYLLSGLATEQAATLEPELATKLIKLRRWRSAGLIDAAEFQSTRKRILGK